MGRRFIRPGNRLFPVCTRSVGLALRRAAGRRHDSARLYRLRHPDVVYLPVGRTLPLHANLFSMGNRSFRQVEAAVPLSVGYFAAAPLRDLFHLAQSAGRLLVERLRYFLLFRRIHRLPATGSYVEQRQRLADRKNRPADRSDVQYRLPDHVQRLPFHDCRSEPDRSGFRTLFHLLFD